MNRYEMPGAVSPELSRERSNQMVEGLKLNVTRVSDGLGFGQGSISGDIGDLSPQAGQQIDRTIESAPTILVPVDCDENGAVLDDDGCGDGRAVETIFQGQNVFKRSLNRAKVFGGGLTMAVAERIGLTYARGRTLHETFVDAQGELAARQIDYGAHTDTHAEGDNCGCGAIDKSPQIVANVVAFETPIRDTIAALGVDTTGIDEVMDGFKSYATEIAGQPYSGKRVMESVVDTGKVVKRLGGEHREKRIILNMVENTTVNQQLIRETSDDQAQVFVTDVWRLVQLAQRLHPDDTEAQQQAFLSELVYTMGVAATLTKGDLPVYVITAQPAEVTA